MSDLFFVVRRPWLIQDEGIILQPGTSLVLLDQMPNLALAQSGNRQTLKFPKWSIVEMKVYLHGAYTQKHFEQGLYTVSTQLDQIIVTKLDSTVSMVIKQEEIMHPTALQDGLLGRCLLTPIQGKWYDAVAVGW